MIRNRSETSLFFSSNLALPVTQKTLPLISDAELCHNHRNYSYSRQTHQARGGCMTLHTHTRKPELQESCLTSQENSMKIAKLVRKVVILPAVIRSENPSLASENPVS